MGPDRFVPQRDSDKSSKQVYQTTKPLQDLSPAEKLLRRKGASSSQYSRAERPPAHASDNARMALVGHPRSQVRNVVSSNSPSAARQPSQGNVWMVGGVAPGTPEMDRNQRRPPRGVTPARLFTMSVNTMKPTRRDDLQSYHGRVASALRIDRIRRVLEFTGVRSTTPDSPIRAMPLLADLEHGSWAQSTDEDDLRAPFGDGNAPPRRSLPTAPFRVLDAPDLRDDFYCSVLAYSPSCQKLAVGLGNVLYIWSKGSGPRAMHGSAASHVWLTSVAFSSSTCDALPRFQVQQPFPVSCVSWRPITTVRPSRNPFNPGIAVRTEDLIIGDDTGAVYYYAVEWPMGWEVTRDTWPGTIYLIAKVSLHTQQICGLSWSPNGKLFATGGNDNLCCLFDADSVEDATNVQPPRPSSMAIRRLGPGAEKHRWIHKAAVKAIAFCPWREGLVATGGGSNDKCIHFYHTSSGAALATIAVSAQVTALIWSSTRREIAATFGYTEPEHPYRIAIFSWPECKQTKATNVDQKSHEGCIVVASSDRSVKFHEIWCNEGKILGGWRGMLGGSGILDSLEGIDHEGDMIR
ncbi:WD40 repeat-like protein [Trichoderma longibrachiatum]